jgi:hypothetical protein
MAFSLGSFLVLCVCLLASFSNALDMTISNSSVWLSAAAYCETNTYMTREFKGYSSGFVTSYVIDDKGSDVQVIIFVESNFWLFVLFFSFLFKFYCLNVTGIHRLYAFPV